MKSILRAQGRLRKLSPVAIVDIGSNSVRLVVYEGLSRSPTPFFNEKILCGLGRHLATTGRLDDEAVKRALAALRRFKILAAQAGADKLHILATAAAREAANGPDFIAQASKITETDIHVLTGPEEAHFAALGIVCGFQKPKGISADMGGGSVEFVPVDAKPVGEGITLPLGGLRLLELSKSDPVGARKIAKEALAQTNMLQKNAGGAFYAVGGTWRAMGRLHMVRNNYPLSVMHHYEITAEEAEKLCRRLLRPDANRMRGLQDVAEKRRLLMPYGAALLLEILKVMKPDRIVFSATGVREGYLYSLLPKKVQKADPLITAAEEMAVLRARSPKHARELIKWTGQAFKTFGISETEAERRYRKAACLLADVTWRSHPNYRGDQALNLISNANFVGVSHAGRAYLSLSSYYRHEGILDAKFSPEIHRIAPDRIIERARVLGALFRVGYLLSAAMPGILPAVRFAPDGTGDSYQLTVPKSLADLEGERLDRRINILGNVIKGFVNWQVEK